MDLVVEPFAFIHAAVGPNVATLAMLVALGVKTLVNASIFPRFLALPVLKIVDPFAFIFRAIDVEIGAVTVGFIVAPLTIEDITVDVIKNASTMRFIVLPLAFVASAIRPSLLAVAVAEAPQPLPAVDCAVLECVLSLLVLEVHTRIITVLLRILPIRVLRIVTILTFFATVEVVLHVPLFLHIFTALQGGI
uniref:Uncharacterized protein n=1 Tax=Favella ehrenbergii TaxID=182087 RepID=A0A7S3I432_9SPIT|eukprot:CAMPEP_0170455012 /NCGR_PEP_ID=MMETSP0123-20130129/3088_1 /TAXON_ID=182087 /ORGANISM="Favella ehrenbergii, Strain Fehren 1" /LENGTH=191 /DNA_ID=CAMNT_0010717947 /DNA_START=952 /DNA_END=1527 /DNA_ORIENTATION=+